MNKSFQAVVVDDDNNIKGKKGKAIPVTGREGPQGCEMSRLPHFL
jgi:hypothetical protein